VVEWLFSELKRITCILEQQTKGQLNGVHPFQMPFQDIFSNVSDLHPKACLLTQYLIPLAALFCLPGEIGKKLDHFVCGICGLPFRFGILHKNRELH
jgi:hypothetical protein